MSLILYNAPQSTCSQKVRVCLEEKNLPYEQEFLDLFQGDQLKPEYQKLNPNGVVPTLVNGNDVIVDSSVIIEYLDEKFPEKSLTPSIAVDRAHMREWMRFFEEVPMPAIRVPSYNMFFLRHFEDMTEAEFLDFAERKPLRKDFFLKMGRDGYSKDEMNQSTGRLQLTIDRMANALQDKKWLVSEYSLADICIFPVMARMADIGLSTLWDKHAVVADWHERISSRAAVKRAFFHGSLLSEKYGKQEST